MAHIRELLGGGPTVSFEFFPPKSDEAARALEKTLHELSSVGPAFVSVTYGAGGTDAHRTRDLVVDFTRTHPFPTMAHLTCMNQRRDDLVALLEDYRANGVENILALGGDPPADGSPATGELKFASELVELVRTVGEFTVAVAAFPELHPRSESTAEDRARLAEKLRHADLGITQFFFDPAPYFRMVEELATLGCTTPILPGVMPVTNPASIRRFAAMNGSRVPPRLWERAEAADGADRLAIAVEAASILGEQLLAGGAPGVHLYTLNRSEAALQVAENLGFGRRDERSA
ncbi:MAG: methylenetetrahydrofolate reductase [Acidimicrobiales bacterium]|nr:methylenetetrahydrofolate reductase [Acidimicrobiales bacterium]